MRIRIPKFTKGIVLLLVWELFIVAVSVQLINYYSEHHAYCKMISIISILSILASALLYYLIWVKSVEIELTYISMALIYSIIICLIIPVYCVPDEQVHYWEAYQLSNHIMGIDSNVNAISMRGDDADLPVKTKYKDVKALNKYYEKMNNELKDASLKSSRFYSTSISDYLYIVPATGITLGRIVGLNAIMVFIVGRMFNAFLFIASTAWAIRKIPIGKNMLYFVSLLPMTMQQIASYSYDVHIMASSFIVIAYTLYVSSGKRMSSVDWIIYLMGSAILLPLKSYAYFLIALLPLVCITKRNKNNKKIITIIIISILFSAVVYFLDNTVLYVEEAPAATLNLPKYYSVQYFLSNPSEIWLVFETTFRIKFGYYLSTMIGESLGWFNIQAPEIMTFIGLVLLLLAGLKRDNEDIALKKNLRIAMISIVILTAVFICAGMLLTWTPTDSHVIEGVQGRYFIPLLPLLLLSIQTSELEIDSKWDRTLIYTNHIWFIVFILCIINRFQL